MMMKGDESEMKKKKKNSKITKSQEKSILPDELPEEYKT